MYRQEGKSREKVTPSEERKQSQAAQRKEKGTEEGMGQTTIQLEIPRLSTKSSKIEQKGRRIWKKVWGGEEGEKDKQGALEVGTDVCRGIIRIKKIV